MQKILLCRWDLDLPLMFHINQTIRKTPNSCYTDSVYIGISTKMLCNYIDKQHQHASREQKGEGRKSRVDQQKTKESKHDPKRLVCYIGCLHYPRVEDMQIEQSIVVTLLDFLLLHLMKKQGLDYEIFPIHVYRLTSLSFLLTMRRT